MSTVLVEPRELSKGSGLESPRVATRTWVLVAAAVVPAVVGPLWVLALGNVLDLGGLGTWTGAILLITMAFSSTSDVVRRRIPNWITYTAFLWTVGLYTAVSVAKNVGDPVTILDWSTHWIGPLGGLGPSIAGAVLGFFPMMFLYGLANSGAGDVKLMTAFGAFLGPKLIFTALICSFLAAGVFALSLAIWILGPVGLLREFRRQISSKFFRKKTRAGAVAADSTTVSEPVPVALLSRPMPMAPFFSIGTLVTLLGSLFS